ncbi:MAG TPA: ATP-dependent DNA helicase, partial [Candidatus Sulfotelmatobacter sp.]|nr:ATP-dependent DNA helicase [Candidatus Sulfotelmatobacter sp.]
TELLSRRVANILIKTDTEPSNILCLTYTNAAATNMRERLLSLIGPQASSVNVQTFHSFCSEIMQLFPEHFYSGASLSIAPDAIQLEIIQDILSKLPHSNPLTVKFNGRYTSLNEIQKALKVAKEAGLTPGALRSVIKDNLSYLKVLEPQLIDIISPALSYKNLPELYKKILSLPPQKTNTHVLFTPLDQVIQLSLKEAIDLDDGTNKTSNTSKWKEGLVQSIGGQKKMFRERSADDWWLYLADVYEAYRDSLSKMNYYDYDDMILEVSFKLESSSELRSLVQEKYSYILIDEFQDTTKAQFRLAYLVADSYAANGRPNLMAVGDDDQSIYAFNGAELSNMLAFINSLKEVKTIILSDNYRSTAKILKASEKIIDNSTSRLVYIDPQFAKNLRAQSNKDIGQVSRYALPTKEQQYGFIASLAKKEFVTSKDKSIAVLARHHSSLVELSKFMAQENIPVSYERQNDVLEQPLVKQIIYILEIIEGLKSGEGLSVSESLAQVIGHPAWSIEPYVLWQFALAQRQNKADWFSALLKSKSSELRDIARWLVYLKQLSLSEPFPVILETILGIRPSKVLTSPYKDYYLAVKEINQGYLDCLSALNTLNALVSEYAQSLGTLPRLGDFLGFVRLNRSLGKQITDTSWYSSPERSIELRTVHGAKGLEYDTVYVIDAVESEWRPSSRRLKSPLNVNLSPYGEHADDYARLAYVAATRAKTNLSIASYAQSSDGTKVLTSHLFLSIEPTPSLKPSSKLESINLLETSLRWPEPETKDLKKLLSPTLENFELTATNFNQYLDIVNYGPDKFLEAAVLRLPEASNETLAFGSAMHEAMQTAQNLTTAGKFSIPTITISFTKSLDLAFLTDLEKARQLEKGRELISRLFKDKLVTLPKEAYAEFRIKRQRQGRAYIGGKIDNISLEGDTAIITDYKTGSPLSSFDTKAKTSAIKAWQHKNQLLFYALLVKNHPRFSNVNNVLCRVVYLEATDKSKMTLQFQPEPEDILRTSRLVEAVYKKVENLEFNKQTRFSRDRAGITDFENYLLKN